MFPAAEVRIAHKNVHSVWDTVLKSILKIANMHWFLCINSGWLIHLYFWETFVLVVTLSKDLSRNGL